MISLEKFIRENTGKKLPVPWDAPRLTGQCVSLVQQYISQCLGQPAQARGNARTWATSYPNEGLGKVVSDLRKGDIIVWGENYGDGYGHIAVYYKANQIFEQNNPWDSSAHLGSLFGSYTILRPNVTLIEDNVGNPVSRDINRDQLQVNVYNLKCRDKGSLSGNMIGFIKEGIYNILNKTEADGYTWYEVETNRWIPNQGDWCTILPKEVKPIDPKDQEIADLKKQLENCNSQIKNLNDEKRKINDELEKSINEVNSLKSQIANQDKQILELKNEISELTDAINNYSNYKLFKAVKDGIYYINLKENEIIMYKS